MKTLDFNLTVKEANLIMQALGNLPYAELFGSTAGFTTGMAN